MPVVFLVWQGPWGLAAVGFLYGAGAEAVILVTGGLGECCAWTENQERCFPGKAGQTEV